MSKEIEIPHNFRTRKYQEAVRKYMEQDEPSLRAVCVWHRRAGKDKTALNITIEKMCERKGVYYYFLPTYNQGKKIIWDGIDKDGFKFIDHFPKSIIRRKNDTEMKLEIVNGSLFQVVGTDNYDSIMGTNPVGCVFSEFSLQNPIVWDFIRPILRENKGWALFLYTPRGRNHGHDLYKMAKMNENWFCEMLTIEDTLGFDNKRIISDYEVEQDRREGMDEDLIQQEYYCSFEGAMVGSYFGKYLKKAREENRMVKSLFNSGLKVNTAWDIGVSDATAIWFFQQSGEEIRLIDYVEAQGEGLSYYIKLLQEKREKEGYIYGEHFAPHDIKVRELTTGKSRLETAQELGIYFEVVPKLPIEEGIDAMRRMFNKCWFDEKKCKRGIECLDNYHKEYDEIRKEYKNKPYHDWSSHGSDAFRYLALGRREGQIKSYVRDPELEEFENIRRHKEQKENQDDIDDMFDL